MSVARQCRKLGGYLVVALVFLVTSGASAAVAAWPVMVALGVGHSEWAPCPSLGFWQVAIILWALRLVTPYRMKFTEPDPQ